MKTEMIKQLPSIARRNLPRVTPWTVVLAVILALGGYYSLIRFTHGLGDVTALTNRTPWGLWVGFDVLCGVGLAAGGFSITAMVYVFNLEKLHSITRPTVLTAWLGYMLVSTALLYDIGRPYAIWHPLLMWNAHSVMFEVSICVTIYTSVLTLEFAPVVLERFHFDRLVKFIRRFTIPLVIMGVLLSTLHQSSLGTVFLIAPYKVHPLWYSTMLPIFFFISAVAVGLAMTIFESFLSYRFLRRQLEMDVLDSLARMCGLVLIVYLGLKFLDLKNKNAFHLLLNFHTQEAPLFLLELALGAVAPLILISNARVRASRRGLFLIAFMVILGFVLNRMNVSVTAFAAYTGAHYFPSFREVMITVFLIALGFIGFGFCVRHFTIFPEEEPWKQEAEDRRKAGLKPREIKREPAI
jgi:Ni/Fe-hydrogenase subunit HybB-like protein